MQVTREELDRQVVHYKVLLKVGPGDFDLIALHRIIRERPSGVPVPDAGSFFFIHGSAEDFRSVLVSPHANGGLAVFLAMRNVDVWGIDLRNVQIPAGTTDFSFTRDWGFDVQIKDVLLATRVARHVRALTGQGGGGITLGGHSSGAALSYAVANAEAVLPKANRDVAGMIPIDMPYKLPPDATAQSEFSCQVEAVYRSFHDAGPFLFDNLFIIEAVKLAQTDPNSVSPYGPPLINLQYALENAGGLSFWPLYPFHPWAVVRDSSGIAAGGRYTTTSEILANFGATVSYSIPNAMIADMFGASCATTDSPYDDNLGQIRLPVLYIGTAGGFGRLGEYTTELLDSRDITKLMIQLQSDANVADDYGHMDPFTADDAPRLVWQTIHAWIVAHDPGRLKH